MENSLKNMLEKHPNDFRGLNPKEFAKEFGNTNYFYQKECFNELLEEYKKQSIEDKERPSLKYRDKKRVQLSSSLENLSTSFYLVVKSMEKVCKACKNYMKNPFEQYF